jgi:uncharacterized SAM-binding protein YcdF (DUF218 family)
LRGAILPHVWFLPVDRVPCWAKGQAEATSARDFFLSLGVPEEKITLEDKSRNTWENGVFTRDVVIRSRENPGCS